MFSLNRTSFQLFIFSSIFFCVILFHWWRREDEISFVQGVFYGFFAVTLLGVSLISFDVTLKRTSDFHTNSSVLNHYLIYVALSWFGWFMRRNINSESQDVKKTQDKTLFDRLKRDAETVYGKDFQFSAVKSREDYVRIHPLTRYSHYEVYIQRQMKGEVSVLTADTPVLFGVTSGTSGRSCILPMTKRQQTQFFFKGVSVSCSAMLCSYPQTYQLQKVLKFFYNSKWRTAPCGTLIGPGSPSPSNLGRLLTIYSTPLPAFQVLDEPKTLYLHLLFGLRDRNIGMLESNFSSSIYAGFKSLDVHWKQIICDIELGCVNADLGIDELVRESLNKLLSPDPVRAAELRCAFADGPVGLAKRLWPHCDLILSTDTGTFALYGKQLQETYCKGIPIFSCLYAATEGLLGVNIWPTARPARFLLPPSVMFYEFIPIEHSDEPQPHTLFMDQVEKDCTYELVVTSANGLCRYRFGDVIKVVDFHNTCPVIEFMYRQGQLLNVHSEKTSEVTFYKALTSAVSKWPGVNLQDYCCAESILLPADSYRHSGPYYLVFLELEGNEEDIKSARDHFHMIDEELCKLSYVYRSYRVKNSIGPMVVHAVRLGAFQDFRQVTVEKNTSSSNQYKVPRVLKRPEALQFVMSKTLS